MRKLLVLGLFVMAASTCAFTQTNSVGASRNARVEEEIRKLEREWFDSYVRGDRAAFDRIVADDVVIT